jgi:hypothetical protein
MTNFPSFSCNIRRLAGFFLRPATIESDNVASLGVPTPV